MNHATTHDAHVTGPKTYSAVLLGLLVFTVITVWVSRFDFGALNTVVALVIASFKASLVALYFMHLRHDRFNAIIFLGGLFFLAVFLVFTLFDIDTRRDPLPANLKQPVQAFPGAPLNKPIQPSTGLPRVTTPAPPQ